MYGVSAFDLHVFCMRGFPDLQHYLGKYKHVYTLYVVAT